MHEQVVAVQHTSPPPPQPPADGDHRTPRDALVDAITVSRMLPLDIALFALTPDERVVVELLMRRSEYEWREAGEAGSTCRVFRNKHRVRVAFGASDVHDGLVVQLSPHECLEIDAAQRLNAVQQTAGLREARSFLERREATGSLAALLVGLAEMIAHMPPVMHYVRDRQYSSLQPFGNNLSPSRGSRGLFVELAERTVASWSDEDVQFVFAGHVLTEAGSCFALEEMNWMQVDTCTLNRYLDGKIAAFAHLVLRPAAEYDSACASLDRARTLRCLRDTLAQTHVMYRSVAGPAMNKRLKCLAGKGIIDGPLPPQLAATLANLFGVTRVPQTDPCDYFGDVATLALERGLVKELIETILRSGLRETNSDFFMSRGPIVLALGDRYAALETSDFYCPVIAREGLDVRATGLQRSVEEVRWNQSLRMKFNSWKFWYGALAPEERSPSQYWFFPALLPDIAGIENTIHPGHRENGVVHSIRAPYPLTLADLRSGVAAGGRRVVPSACDVRGARLAADRPYDEHDLVAAIRHGRWMSTVLQRFADEAALSATPVVIDFFGREFFFAEE